MPDSVGTRTRQNWSRERADQGHESRTHTRDVGMSKRVTSNLTFTAATGRITGANGDFAKFALNDTLLVAGTNLNDGPSFVVTGLDAVNNAYVVVDPPPKNEGPISATVRTA